MPPNIRVNEKHVWVSSYLERSPCIVTEKDCHTQFLTFSSSRTLGVLNAGVPSVPQSTGVYLARICRKGLTRMTNYRGTPEESQVPSDCVNRSSGQDAWEPEVGGHAPSYLGPGASAFSTSNSRSQGNKSNLTP